ncbi:peptidase S64 [Lipomyces arxii]|uniref:peptidase S64 n=1 Tax=Lipomyces arxii TaxID=56418 RepID=UPI0034CE59FB
MADNQSSSANGKKRVSRSSLDQTVSSGQSGSSLEQDQMTSNALPAPWNDLQLSYKQTAETRRIDSVYSAGSSSYAPSVRSTRTASSGASWPHFSSASSISSKSVSSRWSFFEADEFNDAGPTRLVGDAVEGMGGIAMPLRPSKASVSGMDIIAENKRSLDAEFNALAGDVKAVVDQVGRRMMDLSKAATTITSHIRQAISACAHHNIAALQLSPANCSSLASVLKVVLHFSDNLLLGLPYASARSLLLRATSELGIKLKLVPAFEVGMAPPQPRNFAIGEIYTKPDTEGYKALEKVNKLMDVLPGSQVLSEQDGAFIAPISRGFSEQFAVISILFGVPNMTSAHMESVAGLCDVANDIHFFCQTNRIVVAAGSSHQQRPKVALQGFRAPFRASQAEVPPMSMSLANEDAETLSGTLGGYVYPKVDPNDPSVSAYSQSAFAMTCAHVCLTESRERRPAVSVPSPVLVNMYRDALMKEYTNYPAHSEQRRAFKRAVTALDSDYPRQNGRSVPPRFGEVLWGERTLFNGMISDVAIVRCRQGLKPAENTFGDDVPFAEFDPSLMFTNLTVSRIVNRMVPGIEVFKYGSTSKYTTGKLNGPRLIYWADGALQSSEFVVAAASSTMFATGGDSGAWIMRKSGVSGLGVVGMLHAYDGEHREFGLFTPMTRILERLHEVTGIEWGVVGAKEDDKDSGNMVGFSETSDSSHGNDSSMSMHDSSSDSELE